MGLHETAKLLGLDSNAIERGEVIDTIVSVSDITTFRALFGSGLTDEQRDAFSLGASSDDDLPVARELKHHVFGSAPLSDAGKAYADAIFPIRIRAIVGTTLTINTDQVYSGPPASINAGTVIFDGGSVTALATSLSFTAGTVTVVSGSPNQPYHIGILGVNGTQPPQAAPGPAFTQAAGTGSKANPSSPGICGGVGSGGKGDPGLQGNTGSTGAQGNPGTASYPATILITTFDPASAGALVVQTQSGAGGQGGQGGNGGQGQTGGTGGAGCSSGCEGTDGGPGGTAGVGGTGGPGGPGLNGVSSGNPISITFPAQSKQMLQTVSVPAPFGLGGPGGNGGPAGTPGSGGSGGKHSGNGTVGGGASAGTVGGVGAAGTATGAPAAINLYYSN